MSALLLVAVVAVGSASPAALALSGWSAAAFAQLTAKATGYRLAEPDR